MTPNPFIDESSGGTGQGCVEIPKFSPRLSSVCSTPYHDGTALCPACRPIVEEQDELCSFCYCEQCCCVQADILPLAGSGSLKSQINETVDFHDAAGGQSGGRNYAIGAETSTDQTEQIDFVKFLSRPVRIANFTWNESDAVGTSHVYNPWNLYFNDTRVKYKLNNFAFIQCTLKIKILINASPFYYGSMYCGYQPLQVFTPSTIVNDSGTRYLIPYSQRPCVWLTPQANEGAEMTLPFVYFQNWINAQSASAMTNMGQLTFLNYTTLQSANGVAGTGVSVAIYAWAEDVKLSGPSVGLATQADEFQVQADEYGNGIVSAPASALATAASYFRNIPIIGRFATATQMGASAVSSIAKLFGFTNVPVIADTMPFRSEPFPKLASSEIGYPVEKLTLDSKNELSIDPSVAGLDSKDEMVISTLVQKESYLCTATWSTTNVVDDILFTSTVTPALIDVDASTYRKYYLTPMAWISNLFLHWRGDIIFRFRIVASPYHKGRLRISFDPAGYGGENITVDAVSSNVVFTEIVDLALNNEVEFRVPYQQALAFLIASRFTTTGPVWSVNSNSPGFLHNGTVDNGTLTVRVQTALTAPVALSSVSVMVFVRGAENLEFANPINPSPGLTNWTVQSDTQGPTMISKVIGTSEPSVNDQRYLVNFGESVHSLRTLLRRMSLVSVSTTPTDATNDNFIVQKIFAKLPPYYGYDPRGIHFAKGLITPANTYQFNFVKIHPVNWMLPAFVGYRGSMNWTFNTDAPSALGSVRVVRLNTGTFASANDGYIGGSFVKGTRSQDASSFMNALDAGCAGSALTNQLTQAGINVQCPMYAAYRFQSTNPVYTTLPAAADGSLFDMFMYEATCDSVTGVSNKGLKIWSYAGIGTDFSPLFFLNVPTYIFIDAPVVPV